VYVRNIAVLHRTLPARYSTAWKGSLRRSPYRSTNALRFFNSIHAPVEERLHCVRTPERQVTLEDQACPDTDAVGYITATSGTSGENICQSHAPAC
jgi:hypothetical protein